MAFYAAGLILVLVAGALEMASSAPTAASNSSILSCLPSYQWMPGVGCYKGHSDEVTWNQAAAFCETEGTHLAVPESAVELKAIGQVGMSLPGQSWVGVRKVGETWMTVEGKKYGESGFLGWAVGQPSGWGPCIYGWKDGMANDKCEMLKSFICEQKL